MQLAKRWRPHTFQKRSVKFLLEHANCGLLASPGAGKTSCVLAALKILFEKEYVHRVLLIAPLRPCYTVWPSEIEKWADFNGITYSILHGNDKDDALKKDAQLYIINPAGLEWLLGCEKQRYQVQSFNKFTGEKCVGNRVKLTVDVKRFKSFKFDTLIIDELTQFKNTNAQRFKMLKEVLHTFSRRWGLTGSPTANGLLDLFGQCYVLDMGRSLGRFITHYRMQYFQPVDRNGFVWKPRPGGEAEIYERISPLVLRINAEDFIDMPEFVPVDMVVDIPDKVRRVYEELEHDLIAGIQDHVIVAANAASASIKCRQVASGGVYHTDPLIAGQAKKTREWSNLHDAKTEALRELVDELQGSPLLVAYDFEHDVDRLRKEFPDAVFACDIKMRDFKRIEDQWNAGEIPLLFGHPQSIGHGLNLQGNGNNVCWHTLTWNFEFYDQFNRRVLRQGNKASHVFVHHLIVRDSIDEVMLAALRRKESGQNALFEALKELANKRRTKA